MNDLSVVRVARSREPVQKAPKPPWISLEIFDSGFVQLTDAGWEMKAYESANQKPTDHLKTLLRVGLRIQKISILPLWLHVHAFPLDMPLAQLYESTFEKLNCPLISNRILMRR